MMQAPRRQRGFALLEALVALLIFSFGVLGIVGLQATMTKAQTQSKARADASLYAQQIIGTMWSDATNKAQYATANCAAYPRCNDWRTRVAAALPNADPRISFEVRDGVQVALITILWTPPNEQQHKYSTVASVFTN